MSLQDKLVEFVGGVTREEHENAIRRLKRSMAAAMALMSDTTVAQLREKVTERLTAVKGVRETAEETVARLQDELRKAEANLRYVEGVEGDLEQVLNDLPADVEVGLDPLAFNAGEEPKLPAMADNTDEPPSAPTEG